MGGVHPTLFPEQTLKNALVDFVVIGEGEKTALELLNIMQTSDEGLDFTSIDGLGFKRSGQAIINKRRKLMPMDELPFQDFSLLEVERYIYSYYPYVGLRRELLVQSSRGCPHRCAFCINYVERNYNIWRSRNPDSVVGEIKELKKDTGSTP